MKIETKKIEMDLDWELYDAKFISRPNRFITLVEFEKNIYESHLPDPGGLKELLLPEAKLLIKKENNKNRKTKFSTQAIYLGNRLVSLNTWLPNFFFEYLIKNYSIPFLRGWTFHRREVKIGKSRFDFLLRNDTDEKLILEIKSVTLVKDNVAMFPDSVTKRGEKHLSHLAKISSQGKKCMVVFVIQRDDPIEFQPNWAKDPSFCSALLNAKNAGVKINAVKLEITKKKIRYISEVNVNINNSL